MSPSRWGSSLTVCAWLWGTKYGADYVERLARGVGRHLAREHDFCIFSPAPEDAYLTTIPGCFARLRMFDPAWQATHGFKPGDRIVCLDLDMVVTGPLDPVFDLDADFAILQGANASNPCPYNGSLMSFRAGTHAELWDDFTLEAAQSVPFYQFADDQAWYAAKVPNAPGWVAGPSSGVYAFQKPGWPGGTALPKDARLVAFPGFRDPSAFAHLDWVQRHWLGE